MSVHHRGQLYAADFGRIAVFAALIAALALAGTLSPFGAAVPISMQTLGVMLAGSLLGAKRAFLAVVVLLALAAAGLPVLASGGAGLGVFASPRGGYLVGWAFGALVIGWLTERMLPKYNFWLGLACNIIGGIGVIYLFGVPVMAALTDLRGAALVKAAALYLPGDLIKAVVATSIAYQVHRAYPWLAGRVRRG